MATRRSCLKLWVLALLAVCGLLMIKNLLTIHPSGTTPITLLRLASSPLSSHHTLLLRPRVNATAMAGSFLLGKAISRDVKAHVSSDVRDSQPEVINQPPTSLPRCPVIPPNLVGFKAAVEVDKPFKILKAEWADVLKAGGDYKPPDCVPEHRTAIIIPCRNRWSHLRILLNHLIPFLVRQQASFTFFVVESDQASHFNKGILLNAGYLEALKYDDYTCFVFQDVDLLPLNDHNLYRCGSQPRHLAVAIDKFSFNLPYSEFFGGVLALSREQVEQVNGHSNVYFGWGGEDDDIEHRVTSVGYKITRYPVRIARYHMIRHDRDKGNEETEQKLPLVSYKEAVARMQSEGMRQAVYQRDWVRLTPLFTWVKLTVNETEVIQSFPKHVRDKFKNGLTLRHW